MSQIAGILGPVPLTVLALSGAFVIASLSNGGVFLVETSLFFIYAVVAAYARQIYKDMISFSQGKYTVEERRKWGIYYRVQFGLFIAVVLLAFFMPISRLLSDLLTQCISLS